MPAIYDVRGGDERELLVYAAKIDDVLREAARVNKILKGARPGDLPIGQPTKFEQIVNLGTAKALGLTIPQSVLVGADRFIQ